MKSIQLFLISIFMLACQQKQESTNANLSSKNEELVHQYFEYFNQHDWKKMAAMYSDTAAFKDPTLGQDIVSQTHNDIIKKYSALQQTFADIHDEVQSVYPSGENNIIVEFISTGTAPDSTTFKLPICTIFTIENGLITKDFTYFDNFEE